MHEPKRYNIQPARGQAILNFQGRRFPDSMDLYEVELIEEVRQKGQEQLKLGKDKQTELNPDFRNLLIHGDCLSACAYLKAQDIKVDLVYIDPPYASGAKYTKNICIRTGLKNDVGDIDYQIGEEVMYDDIWQKEDYLNWLYERLLAIRDIMSDGASIYVQLDWHICHYVKVLMDEVFGEGNFQRELIWRIGWVSGYKSVANNWIRNHETILYYTKNIESRIFNKTYVPYPPDYERWGGRPKGKGLPIEDVWGVFPQEGVTSLQVVSYSSEDRNYVTQKPEGLLRRIINASSDEGMIVADFFLGSGTTTKAAYDLGRKFIGCDIGNNAIQTSRDCLTQNGAEFDILKIKDGILLFRNPAQTTAKIFTLIEGYRNRNDLGLGEFWDGGILGKSGSYIPIKFIGIEKKLTKEYLDLILEEIYSLEDSADQFKIIYAYKDIEIDQNYVNKAIRESGKSTAKVELVGLNDLLGQKADLLYMPDNAEIDIREVEKGYQVEIKRYFSSYLKNKIDDFNAKKVKNQDYKPIKISARGLELIESVQFDTTLKKGEKGNDIWTSNLSLEDKAGVKEKIKGVYYLTTNKFQMKIRNIAGDEIIIDNSGLN